MPDASLVSESSSDIQRLREDGVAELANQFWAARTQLLRFVSLRLSPQLTARIDPSDVIQDAFMEANRRLPEFLADPKVRPITWFRQITRQTLALLYRKHQGTALRNVNRESDVPLLAPGPDSMVLDIEESILSPPSEIARAEITTELLKIISSMDDLEREVLSLKALEQKTFSEVAEELQISVRIAMKRFQQAMIRLGKLAAHLNDLGVNDE